MSKVLIVGGGPSGLMCGVKASRNNEVIIIEKNEKVGKKIYITGKGRCNVTNNCSNQEFINNVVTNPKFLYSAINHFSCGDTMNFFEAKGVKLVTERGNRVFPYSYHASDITKALLNTCLDNNVKIKYLENVIRIEKENDKFFVTTNKSTYLVDKVVVATGGMSYPQTGSTGDGYLFAKGFNIDIVNPTPGLVPLLVKDEFPKELYNFTFKNVKLSAFFKPSNRLIHSEFGELMTMKGSIGGPIALTMSSIINKINVNDILLELDLKPALTEEILENRINNDIVELRKKANSNAYILLRGLVPSSLIPMVLKRIGVESSLLIKSFSHEIIVRLINILKHFKLEYAGLDSFSRAIITSGGISVKEINPKTMEVKKIPGLFFVGEVLDVDAFTGGFNMQIALSSGACCGDYLSSLEIE